MKKVLAILVAMLILISVPASAATTKRTVTKKTVTKKITVVKSTKKKTTKKKAAKTVKTKAPKNIPVTLTYTPESIVAGQAITLTAASQNQGSYVQYSWSVNDVQVTNSETYKIKLNKLKGKYVSTLTFTPTADFKVNYSIKMGAGKSAVTFVGNAEKTVKLGIAKVTVFTPVPKSITAVTDPTTAVTKYTITISQLNVTREYSVPAVENLTQNIVVDVTGPAADTGLYQYTVTFEGITKTFTLTPAEFNALLTPAAATDTTNTANTSTN